jgi:meso-butanediol dehydrogenase/(S,S)-butanediol dehydrogenase/diacetyl reductase
MSQLDGKVAIVTGGSSGIGEATARLFAKEGAKVAIASLTPGKADPIVADIQAAGGEAMATALDVKDEAAVEAFIKEVAACFGRVDILYNAAGSLTQGGAYAELTESFDNAVRTSVHGTYFMCKHVVPHMEAAGGGTIVNTSSVAAVKGNLPDYSPLHGTGLSHSAGKAALEGYTRGLAVDVGIKNIRVNCVRPGWVQTPRTMRNLKRAEGIMAYMLGRQVLKTFSQPEDLANAILFLASPASRTITGQVLTVDGGQTLT